MAWDATKPTNSGLLINAPALIRANWDALALQTDASLLVDNDKVAVAAGIVESKITFDGTSGHAHSGGAQGKLISLTAAVTGTLPIANGGTALTSAGGVANRVMATSDGSTWAAVQIDITTMVSGTLPTGSGGTGSTDTDYCDLTANVTGTLPTGNGGTGSVENANAADGVCVLDGSGYVPDDSVDTGALKTAISAVSVASPNGGTGTNVTLPGGEYGFYPQTKGTDMNPYDAYIAVAHRGTAYATIIFLDPTWLTVYAQQRYVTSSGLDHWLFILVDKITKGILACSFAPDHPAYGNGGDFEKLAHPFCDYDSAIHDIVLVDNDTIAELKLQITKEKSFLELVNEEYKVDITKEEVYKPLHSGRFIDKKPVLVKSIPDYIKVRKLIKLTDQEKSAKVQRREQKQNIKKQAKETKKNKLKQKLGLNDQEFQELKEVLK